MSHKKAGKRYGSRGFTVASNPGAVAAELDKNERLIQRVLAVRKKKGQKPDANGYIFLDGEAK